MKKKARAGAFAAANIDTAGMDPEMQETLGGEAARRVGAAGIQMAPAKDGPMQKLGKYFQSFGKKK